MRVLFQQLGVLAAALGVTLAIELPVAVLFGLGRRGLAAVVLVNVVTNPVANLAFDGFSAAGQVGRVGWMPQAWALGVLFFGVELAVILSEWALLRWALNGTEGGLGKIMRLSVAMNVASAAGGSILLTFVPLCR